MTLVQKLELENLLRISFSAEIFFEEVEFHELSIRVSRGGLNVVRIIGKRIKRLFGRQKSEAVSCEALVASGLNVDDGHGLLLGHEVIDEQQVYIELLRYGNRVRAVKVLVTRIKRLRYGTKKNKKYA